MFFSTFPVTIYIVYYKGTPAKAVSDVKIVINKRTKACDEYHKTSPRSYRFLVLLLPGQVILNHEAAIAQLWLEGTLVLHGFCTHIQIYSAGRLQSKSATDIGLAFPSGWTTVFPRHSRVLISVRVAGAGVNSKLFGSLVGVRAMEMQKLVVEAHNAIDVKNRYHGSLKRTYSSARQFYPNSGEKLALRPSIKGRNCTMVFEGLVPSLLVFGF